MICAPAWATRELRSAAASMVRRSPAGMSDRDGCALSASISGKYADIRNAPFTAAAFGILAVGSDIPTGWWS
jgi:hypothetical protein